jgi:hypothetical protein
LRSPQRGSPTIIDGRVLFSNLTKRLPNPLGLECDCAVSIYIQFQTPVIDRFFTKIAMIPQDMDEGIHAVSLLHFLDKIKAPVIDCPFL